MENEDKNRVPKLRYPGYTDPWVLRKLGEVVNITMGQSPSSVNYTDDSSYDVLVQGNADLKNGWVIPRVWTKQVTKKGKRGDIILSVRAPVGEVAKTSFDVVLGRGVASVTGNEFVYQALLRLKTNGYWRRLSTGSTFESINSNDIKNANLFFTEKNEQQAIGSLFKKIDNLIVLQQRKIEHLRKRKAGLLQKMFPKDGADVPEVRFPEYTDAWVLRKLNDIGNTYNSLSGKSKEDFNHGDAHYVTYLNVFNNPVSSKNGIEKIEIDSKQQQVKYGDIFFTTSSETPEEVGMSSVWIYNIPNTYLNSFCFGYRLNVKYNLFFLSYVFRNIYFRKQIIKLAQGISRYNISKKKVLQLSISIPKLGEQEAIGSLFKKFDDLIALQQRKLEHLELQKRGLLQQMFV